jgi:hypothetical protein
MHNLQHRLFGPGGGESGARARLGMRGTPPVTTPRSLFTPSEWSDFECSGRAFARARGALFTLDGLEQQLSPRLLARYLQHVMTVVGQPALARRICPCDFPDWPW